MKNLVIVLLCLAGSLFAGNENVDQIIQLFKNATTTDAASNDETEKNCLPLINELEKNLKNDSIKIGLALIDAYEVAVRFYQNEAKFNKDKAEEYAASELEVKNKQNVMFHVLFNSKDSSNVELALKMNRYSFDTTDDFKRKVAGWIVANPKAKLWDINIALIYNCSNVREVRNICAKYKTLMINQNNYNDLEFIFSTCVRCLENDLSDEDALDYSKLIKNALLFRKKFDNDRFDENEIIGCTQNITELETRIKIKKEKEAKEKKEKEQTK